MYLVAFKIITPSQVSSSIIAHENTNLVLVGDKNLKGRPSTVGILDMGGASAQIACKYF